MCKPDNGFLIRAIQQYLAADKAAQHVVMDENRGCEINQAGMAYVKYGGLFFFGHQHALPVALLAAAAAGHGAFDKLAEFIFIAVRSHADALRV